MTRSQPSAAVDLRDTLRQMLAVLHAERHSLAALDLESVVGAAADKRDLCDKVESAAGEGDLDAECRGLAETARRLNEANRQVRNLIAAGVAARLEALTGLSPLYAPPATGLSLGPRC